MLDFNQNKGYHCSSYVLYFMWYFNSIFLTVKHFFNHFYCKLSSNVKENAINPLVPKGTNIYHIVKNFVDKKKGSWVGRRLEPILGYISIFDGK